MTKNIKITTNSLYMSENKIKLLQESIGWLDNYTYPDDTKEFHYVTVGDDKDELHIGKTQALSMLAGVNEERKTLIEILLK